MTTVNSSPRQRLRIKRLLALSGIAAASAAALFSAPASAATGPYAVKFQEPADLKDHVVYRPTNAPAGAILPVLVWGEGGCIANGLVNQTFLTEIASHGILVIASGGPLQIGVTNVGYMDRSIDWAKAQNAKAGGALQGRLDATHVVAAGWSCGGLEAYQLAAKRTEVAALGIMNSGQITVSQAQLDRIHVPTMWVLGGSGDVAYANGVRDYNHIDPSLPAVLASTNTGHFGTYFNDNGGRFAQILKDWTLWRISGNTAAGQTFAGGATCGLCLVPSWTVSSRNL